MKFDSNGNVIIIEYFCPQCDGTNVSGFKRKFDEETQLWEKYDSGDCFCNDCDEPLNKESRHINPVRILCVTREIKKDVTKDELIGSKSDLIKGYDKI
tara:strand:- start:19 stop:312 length:294 start_codon:yes stop_codon:yes gene_type:complete